MRTLRLLFLRLLALLARPWVLPPTGQVQRILYIKPDHLGDLLLATPVLAALRQAHPDAQIAALVGPWSRMVLERNRDVDVLQICPFPGFERQPKNKRLPAFSAYTRLLHYAALLRAGRYDLAIIGRDDHWWGAALALLAGVPLRVGFAVPECQLFLTTALPWNAHDHVTQQGLELVRASTTRPITSHHQTTFTPAPADTAWANDWLAANLERGQHLVIIHPGTGGWAKHWLNERWAEVADALAVEPGVRVVLTGGPGEEARVAEVQASMNSTALDLAGKTSVGQLAALMARATLVLGVDSGPLHLAAATGARTIHLYGPGDPARFGPWGDPARHMVLQTNLWCQPCGEFSACPRGLAVPECMERLSVEEVLGAGGLGLGA